MKITDHCHSNKYITTQEFSRLTVENFEVRLAQARLANKADIADFVKKTDFGDKLETLNRKVTSIKTKHIEVEKKITDLTNKVVQISEKEFDFLTGRIYFTGNNVYQDFLVFSPMFPNIREQKKVTN